ncbi:MAG: aspartate--tRNA ligase [Archangium gephyra]|uniref:Aspartate--tRNA(Asp/Asn) ligase n=1 Tax=Archangium gephyra TaxID=48 RepID=A0A2W5VLR5_9BACT|nr:MAG: aspartate--tRNA ligase [Archangium gephyra]
MSEFISKVKRTHSCGALRAKDIKSEVVLFGWVQNRRDHGGLIFIDLRDREGLTQIVFDPGISKDAHKLAESLRSEWVIGIRGEVRSRGMQWSKKENKEVPATNPNLATGEVEVYVSYAEIFNKAETPPFEISEHSQTSEEKRLEYRYLDLRRPNLQKTLITRSKMNAAVRSYFHENGFLELETPFMGRYTPGGARNFLVPSRLNPGKFYALAESPQLYKQLFMVAGFERYFQIVKCFRDEDLRLDRQPEFTQIDVEMSFVTQEDIFEKIEGLLKRLWKEVHDIDLPTPFRRMNFDESMAKYGNDKPDLRFGMEHVVLNDIVAKFGAESGVGPLWETLQAKGLIKAMVVSPVADGQHDPGVVKAKNEAFRAANPNPTAKLPPPPKELSRKEIEETEAYVVGMGAKGLARAKIAENGDWTQAPLFKTATPEFKAAIIEATGARPGDLILFQFGSEAKVHTIMANLRVYLAKKLWLIPEYGAGGKWNFLWVVNPPLFEYDEDSKTWAAAHHAFTRPMDECLKYLEPESFDPAKVYCYRYDVVLNGFEIGGGSIRLHDPVVQAKVFKAMGISDEDARSKFGFLLDALKFGAPPHGGLALGMDRLAFLITETESLRDVIPFPKTQKGTDLMTLAPGDVDEKQLRDLYVKSTPPAKS